MAMALLSNIRDAVEDALWRALLRNLLIFPKTVLWGEALVARRD